MIALLMAGCANVAADSEGVIALRGRIIDGTGAPPVEKGVVVLEGDKIRCAGSAKSCRIPKGASVIEAGEGTILPGLIDLHTHVRPHYLWMFLAAGVTSFRDLNNDFPVLEEMGKDGPDRARIFWSGPLVDGEQSVIARAGGRIFNASTPDAARAAVDSLVERGVDVIKLYEQIPPEAFVAAAARARELKVPTAADLGIQLTRGLTASQVDALQALEAGVTSIEHMSGFALAYRRLGGDPTREPLDPALIDTLARTVVQRDAAVVPTLVVATGFVAESLAFARELPLIDHLPEGFTEFWTGMHGSLSPAKRQSAVADLRLSEALVRRIHELGGRIGAGSDTPAGPFDIPGGGLHYELELLVMRGGLSPLDAIRAATAEAARILGKPDRGVLARGNVADLIVVDGNPAREIRDTRKLRTVIKGGRAWPVDSLLARGAVRAD
jgi:imidazolonepropionase-like amidohydrolase